VDDELLLFCGSRSSEHVTSQLENMKNNHLLPSSSIDDKEEEEEVSN